MRLFKCRGTLDVFWPLDSNDESSITSNLESDAAATSSVVLDLGMPHKPIM